MVLLRSLRSKSSCHHQRPAPSGCSPATFTQFVTPRSACLFTVTVRSRPSKQINIRGTSPDSSTGARAIDIASCFVLMASFPQALGLSSPVLGSEGMTSSPSISRASVNLRSTCSVPLRSTRQWDSGLSVRMSAVPCAICENHHSSPATLALSRGAATTSRLRSATTVEMFEQTGGARP